MMSMNDIRLFRLESWILRADRTVPFTLHQLTKPWVTENLR